MAVRSPFVEPGLGESLHSELAEDLANRGLAGEGAPVELRVLDASTRVIGWEGELRILSARLELELFVGGAHPRSTRIHLEESFVVTEGSIDEGTQARHLAFLSLADRAATDAADWLVYAPAGRGGDAH